MNISFDKTSNVTATLTIQMGKADYEENVKKAIKTASQRAQIPGFRPGKVPVSLVKKMYGTQAKADEVNKLLSDSLFNYIKDNKIGMLGEPMTNDKQAPQDIEKQDDFEFIFDIALAPEFKIELGKDDTIDYYDIEIGDEQINTQVEQLAQTAGEVKEAETFEGRDVIRGTLAELDENGQPKEGGIVVDQASLMPAYFKSDEQKALFNGCTKNTVITFNPSKAYEGNDTEIASLFKIEKEKVAEHSGDFSFQIDSISHFAPAEIGQTLFDRVFGEGVVKTEEEFRGKIKEQIAIQNTSNSDYKFLLDLRAYAENKVGELEFPNELLKRFMKEQNKDKGEDFVEKNFDASIAELKWHLIKEQLVEAYKVKVDDKDVKAVAIQTARFQFAQYGMNNIPEEYLEQYATEMLKKKESVNGFVEQCIDRKISAAAKDVVTLNHKSISAEDFGKMFEK